MGSWSGAEIAQVVAAVTTLIVSVVAAVAAAAARRFAAHAHREVQTLNQLTIGQLAARAETRRILAEPVEERTEDEIRHVTESPLPPKPKKG